MHAAQHHAASSQVRRSEIRRSSDLQWRRRGECCHIEKRSSSFLSTFTLIQMSQAAAKREWDPTMEPLMKLLMSKKGINNRTATEVGKKVVTIIRGKELTEFLLNNGTLLKKRCPEALKKCLDGKAPETEADNAKLVIPLITNGFMFRCVDATIQATDKPSGSTERRRRKWPDRVGRVAPQHQGYDPKGLYIVEWEGSKTMQYVLLAVVITAVLLMCLFPVWPMWAKLAVWYLTVAFSTFMTVLLVIRMICYVALWAFGADFWIFPNLLDEDLGVIESFQPLYSFAYRSDDWLMIVCRVLSVGVIAIAIHQLSQTHSLSDIGEFAKVQFLDIVEWGENKLQNGPEMKQRFPSLEQVKQETEIDGDNDTARVNTDYTTQDTGDYEDDLDETFEEETLHHRRQDSGDSSREDGWSSPSVAGSSSQGTGTVTTILPPPRPRSEPAVKEVAALGGLFGGYSSSSESEDDSVEEMQDEQDESSVEGVTGTRLESGGKPAQSKVAPIESTKDTPHHPVGGRMGRLRSMIAELVRPTIEATGGGIREKALAAAPWPVRQQVARLQNLCGDDKSSAQWRQLDCRLEDCLEESKLTITRLAEATADGVAVYLHSQPKIPDLEGRSTESSVVSSESVVDELMSQVSGPPESSPEEVLGDGPTGAVVFSRPPEIDEAVLKQVTESRVAEVVDPEEIERELEALAATHEKEVARRKWEDDFPIDGFKLASGELEERTSKWACKPNEGMDEMDRRRCTTGAEKKLGIFSRTPRVHLKDPNRAADRSTHGLRAYVAIRSAAGGGKIDDALELLLSLRLSGELQPIAFEMQNDKNAGNYLYDKHYWGYICSPKFEGKTYKEMKEMLAELLEKCDMTEGRCRFKLEPPSRWEKLKRIRRRRFSLDRVPPEAYQLQATVAVIGLLELVIAPVWRNAPAALGLAFAVLVRYDASLAPVCSMMVLIGYAGSVLIRPEWEATASLVLLPLLFVAPVLAVFLLVLLCGLSEDLLGSRLSRLEAGLLAQLAACASLAFTSRSASSVPAAWAEMLASTLLLFGVLLALAKFRVTPRWSRSPLCSLVVCAVFLIGRSTLSEAPERSIGSLMGYIGTVPHLRILAWWALAILVSIGATQLAESAHIFGHGPRATVIVRKLFHLLAVVIFQPFIFEDPQFLGFSQLVAFGLFVVLEALRVHYVDWKAVRRLSEYLSQYLDGKDPADGGLILTHISLLLGMAIPVWFELGFAGEFSVLRASAGVLSVGVGDAMAACVGVTVKGPKMPGAERRTIAGCLGFVLSAMLYGFAVSGGNWAVISRRNGMVIYLTALLECYITSIDNLVLPVYMLALMAF
ncbi:hypothetical protein FOL46_006888 [Perkinsus olseni]|nr:hypothetical protein FOL46_006888 [Perkinsus olseni]